MTQELGGEVYTPIYVVGVSFKTEYLSSQQGYKIFLTGKISGPSKEELETMWDTVEAETNPVNQKQ